ncbi:hypothetical protein WJX79_010116 [Trebouxia sp. C0005]
MNGPCYQFQQGTCRYGSACRFAHSTPLSRSSYSTHQKYDNAGHELRQWSCAAASSRSTPEINWSIRVMSYNVLADKLAYEHARELYRTVHRNFLRFSNRMAQMGNDFEHLLPDILSLQEVDRLDDFVECLGELGYHFDFAKRSGDKADGCAIFWNAAKLKCRDSKVINFSHLGLRDNVAQIMVLENCSDHRNEHLVVANTHILFNPKRGEIKVAQVRIILEAVDAMCQLYGGNVPCMFMGDLNLTPDSPLYSFIASGQLDCAANDPRNLSGQQEARAGQQAYTPSPFNRRSPHASQGATQGRGGPLPPHCQPCVDRPPSHAPRLAAAPECGNSNWTPYKAAPSARRMSSGQRGGMDQQQLAIAHTREIYDPSAAINNMLQHPLRLQSAYMEVTGSEPDFTSCHDRFCGTVDYIWYTPQMGSASVRPVAVLSPPQQHFVSRGLPTADFPSDHRQASQPRAVCRTPTVCISKVGEAEFQSEVLKSDTPVLVDFWATWCGPCKLIEKPLANMEKELDGKLKIVKVEADPNPGLVEKYKVYGLPTLVVFKDGKVLDGSQREGAISEAELRKYLDKWEVGN